MNKLCHECREKAGHKRKDKGFHTAYNYTCDDCGEVKLILPERHYKLIRPDRRKNCV